MKPILTGVILGAFMTTILLYLLNMSGMVVVTGPPGSWTKDMLHWSYANLGLSIIPFTLVAVMYAMQLNRLRDLLSHNEPAAEEIEDAESKLSLMIGVFIGIGVIWTAIGMRSALLHSLNGMDAETAAARGSWYILTRMVDGGILLALSTTIFGGIGGFSMRIIKSWTIGSKLSRFYQQNYSRPAEEARRLLEEIRDRLERQQQSPNPFDQGHS